MANNSKKESKTIKKSTSLRGFEEEFAPHTSNQGVEKTIFSGSKNQGIQTLYDTVKASPEVTACFMAIIEDILADGWKFEGTKSAIEKAEKFQLNSNYHQVLADAILDLLITGNAYILKLSVNADQIKSIIEIITAKVAKSLHVNVKKDIVLEMIKQDVKIPKDLQLLKASTIKINFDETGKVTSYEQAVQGKTRVFAAKDIIHLSLMHIGGQPYGFTPLEPLLRDIATLIFAKEFAGKYFENDGIPYFMFNLPKAAPGGREYEQLKTDLKELQKLKNKYKAIVTTGEVNSTQINKFNKDMEFAKLIQHFTQIVLMALGVPAHRINLTIDVRQIGGAVNRAYEGYYKKISFTQLMIGQSLNGGLWEDFSVTMKFRESYKIDELREAQIVQILTQGGLVTVEEARELMGLEPAKPSGTEPTPSAPAFGNVATDVNQRAQAKDPNKVDGKQDNKLKSADDSLEVSYLDFVKIVEHKVGPGAFDQANVLYYDFADCFVLLFSDGSWKYKTRVEKKDIKVDQFVLEKLRNAVKLEL